MYKFKASQFYKVEKEGVSVHFDYFGEYATKDEKEVELLQSLTPTYVQLVEEPKPKKVEKKEEPKVEVVKEEKEAPKSEKKEEVKPSKK